MQLRQYLKENRLTPSQFAEMMGAGKASASGVKKWIRGERFPRTETLGRIIEITGGAVTADDIFAARAAPAPQVAAAE